MHYINRCLEPGRILNYREDIISKKMFLDNGRIFDDIKQAGMIELQLTDKCNLNCFHCHFRNQGDVSFNRDWLKLVVEDIKPKAISLAGGGEPTLYPNFDETIKYLKNGFSNPDIGLITNGVLIPKGDWPGYLSWLRVSLYSVINGTYAGKNSTLQSKVMENILAYMKMSQLDMLGVSLLYYNSNIVDCIELAYELFNLLKFSGRSIDKFNLQFKRAFVMSDPRNLTLEVHEENLKLLPTLSSIQLAIDRIDQLTKENFEFGIFLKKCSNYTQLYKLLSGNLEKAIDQTDPNIITSPNFCKCYTVLENRLITPDGYVYSCPTIAENRDISTALGHITDNPQVFYEKICMYYNCKTKWCTERFCRHSAHNKFVEDYLLLGKMPKYDEEILKDNFF